MTQILYIPIQFPKSLLGWEEDTVFALHPVRESQHIFVLQSLQEPAHFLYLANPWLVLPSYQLELSQEDLDPIASALDECLIFLPFHIQSKKECSLEIYVDLLSPLLIDPQTHVGRRVIFKKAPAAYLHRTDFTLHLDEAPNQEALSLFFTT